MPLKINDETAGKQILIIDDTGLICLGDGTPITQITVSGVGVVDESGLITNQRLVSGSINCSGGSVYVGPNGGQATITTLSGAMPSVGVNTQFPSQAAYVSYDQYHNPVNHYDAIWAPVHTLTITSGSFKIYCTATATGGLTNTGLNFTASYSWI